GDRDGRRHQSASMPGSCQGLVAEPGDPPPITVVPLISHTRTCPVLVLYQRMSLIPSPLKSPVSTIVHGLAAEPGEPPPMIVAPLISHITVWPFVVLYQRMSLIPSPLKSPVPATTQSCAVGGRDRIQLRRNLNRSAHVDRVFIVAKAIGHAHWDALVAVSNTVRNGVVGDQKCIEATSRRTRAWHDVALP